VNAFVLQRVERGAYNVGLPIVPAWIKFGRNHLLCTRTTHHQSLELRSKMTAGRYFEEKKTFGHGVLLISIVSIPEFIIKQQILM